MKRWCKDAETFKLNDRLSPWYKMGCWAAPPTEAQLAGTAWPVAVVVGPPEHEDAARAQGIKYQVADSLELAAFGSDVFAANDDHELEVARSQGVPC